MQLVILLAILLSFSGVHHEPGASSSPPAWPILAACLLAAPLTAFAASAWLVRGIVRDFPAHGQWIDRYERWQRIAMLIWLGAVGVAFGACHWALVVRDSGGWTALPLVADLMAFAPVLGTLLLIWTAFWFVERSLCPSPLRLGNYLVSQMRHFLLLPLLPVLLVLAGREGMEWCAPRFSSTGPGQLAQGGVLLGLLVFAPIVVRRIWCTTPLAAGEVRTRLLATCERGGCRLNDILLWDTGGRMANAAILGFFPGMRYLLVTDALLTDLNAKELELVMRHEATHVARRHLLLRIAVLVAPLWMGYFATRAFPETQVMFNDLVLQVGLGGYEQMLMLALAAGYAVWSLGWISHRLEHEADLGVVFTQAERPMLLSDTAGLASEANEFAQVLCRITGDVHHASWLHPSVQRRVEFLGRCSSQPERAFSYRRQTDWLWFGLAAAYLLPAISAVVF